MNVVRASGFEWYPRLQAPAQSSSLVRNLLNLSWRMTFGSAIDPSTGLYPRRLFDGPDWLFCFRSSVSAASLGADGNWKDIRHGDGFQRCEDFKSADRLWKIPFPDDRAETTARRSGTISIRERALWGLRRASFCCWLQLLGDRNQRPVECSGSRIGEVGNQHKQGRPDRRNARRSAA